MDSTQPRRQHRPGRTFLLIFALALVVQAVFLRFVPRQWVEPHTRWEVQAIAVSLAETGRFANPYLLPTGPTAHLPPIPPALTGLVYRIFGLSRASGYVAWMVHALPFAILWGLLPWFAARIGLGTRTGVLAGCAGALLPTWLGHGEGLAALSILLLVSAFLARWRHGDGRTEAARPLGLGLGAGIALHIQPAILPILLGLALVDGARLATRNGRRHAVRSIVCLTVGVLLACLPWGWRNYRAFDTLLFVRGNFGLELRMGHHEGATATMDAMDRLGGHRHPRTDEIEARRVQKLGEAEYMRQAGREAMDWIAEHPGRFVRLTLARVVHWWLGPLDGSPSAFAILLLAVLALIGGWTSIPRMAPFQRAALLVPLLAFPLVYYLVAYMPRYRLPIDWIFLLLAGSAASSWIGRLTPPSPALSSSPRR